MKDLGDALGGGERLRDLLAAADAGDALSSRSRDGEVAGLALQALQAVAGEVAAAQDIGAASEELGKLYDEAMLTALGIAWRVRRSAVAERLFALRSSGIRGIVTHVERLEKEIRAAAERARQEPASLNALLRPLGLHKANLESPPGWTIDARGVWERRGDDENNVARYPLVISGLGRDLDTGEIRWKLSWRRGERWSHAEISRVQGADARSLVALAAQGGPVASSNGGRMVQYLADFEAWNLPKLEERAVTSHLGWQADKSFLSSPVGEGVHLVASEGEMKLAQGWGAQAGTWEGWCEVIRAGLAERPLAVLGLCAALVPVVLSPLRQPGFTVDWSGDSSIGKTTTLRVAASVWGFPCDRDGIIRGWNASSDVGPTTYAALLHSLPLILDDTQHMKSPRQRETVEALLYGIPAGQDKLRGAAAGGLRTPKTWRTVMLSTGETAITSFSGAGGAHARALCLRGAPFRSKAEVKVLSASLFEHYGHLGPRFVALVRRLVDSGDLAERWTRAQDFYGERSTSAIQGRVATYVALLDLVASLLVEHLSVPIEIDEALAIALEAAQDGGAVADRGAEALREVYSWATTRLGRFYRPGAQRQRYVPDEILGRWDIDYRDQVTRFGIRPAVLRELLEGWGYSYGNVVESWRQRGWLDCESGRSDRPVRIGAGAPRMVVVVVNEAVRAILAEDQALQ